MSTAAKKSSSNKRKLKNEANKKLFRVYSENQDQKIRAELINNYLYIAEILAKKYANKGIEYEDIYQVACVGLIYAIEIGRAHV